MRFSKRFGEGGRNLVVFSTLVGVLLMAPDAFAAEELDDRELLINLESSVSLGLGYVDDDGPRYGMYSGKDDNGLYGLGEVDIVRRDNETGTWLKLRGRNLGLDSREVRLEHERQGDWGFAIDYSQLPRLDPYSVNTGLEGVGQRTQVVNGTAARDVELQTERDILTLAVKKYLPSNFDFNLKFRNEEKDGSRIFGQGGFGGAPNNFFFLTDPIDSTTRQVDAILSYTGKKLQLAGGYYGSFFNQHINRIDVTGGTGVDPIATPPGNQSHQFYLTGGYSFTPTTRGTFKVAYSKATQDEKFIAPHVGGRTNLDAAVDTFSLNLGVNARPLPKLSLIGKLRYENRDDRAAINTFITPVAAFAAFDGTNVPHSRETTTGKFEASYRLPEGFRVTGGVDVDYRDRTIPNVRSVSYREENDEISYRLEVKRALSETINGRVSYVKSKRDGSAFLTNLTNGGAIGSNLINPWNFANRDRDKIRMMVDWVPLDTLSLQFTGALSSDEYSGSNGFGPREGSSRHLSVDAAYTLSDEWKMMAWYSHEKTDAEQLLTGNFGIPTRQTKLDNTTDAFGLGLRGSFFYTLKVGVDFSYSFDRGDFDQNAITGAPIAQLPNVHYRRSTLNVYAIYPFAQNSGVRLDFVHDRWQTNDWQWDGFTFNDGTVVSQPENQILNYVGVTAYYKFW